MHVENFLESIEGVKAACAVNISEANYLAVLCTILPSAHLSEKILASKAAERFKDVKFEGGIHIVEEIPRNTGNSLKMNRKGAQDLALKLMTSKNGT